MIKKVLIPSDPILFKQELLKTKQAKRILLYKDGRAKVENWNASKFTPSSDLMGNIDSQLGHRKDRLEILEAIYEVEYTSSSFVLSDTKTIPTLIADVPASLYHVARAEDVPLTEDVVLICKTLEEEYASVIHFVKSLPLQVECKYIPIIISNKELMQDSPDGGEKILGAFFASNKPYIEIYYRNADSRNPAEIKKCLAHEYLHYLHYVYAGEKYEETSKELKEGLADFFGVLYSIYRGQKDDIKVAQNRYNRWIKNFGTYWAYANALYFYEVHGKKMKFSSDYKKYEIHGSIGKFIQVFGSTRHPDDAYNAMKES